MFFIYNLFKKAERNLLCNKEMTNLFQMTPCYEDYVNSLVSDPYHIWISTRFVARLWVGFVQILQMSIMSYFLCVSSNWPYLCLQATCIILSSECFLQNCPFHVSDQNVRKSSQIHSIVIYFEMEHVHIFRFGWFISYYENVCKLWSFKHLRVRTVSKNPCEIAFV